jgi:hypothetical protein
MKNFVKDNWYKLMIGSSMMMASFGFMIYAISPAYSNSDKEKTEFKNTGIPNAPVGTNGVIVEGYAYFVDGGYMYKIETGDCDDWFRYDNKYGDAPEKKKLP